MKKVISAVMVAAFVMSASVVLAAKVTCTVDEVAADGKVNMTCKNADKIKKGDKVTVKAKKKKAIEGC